MDTSDLPEILKIELWCLDAGFLLKLEAGLTKKNMFVNNIRQAREEIADFISEEYLKEKGGDQAK